MSEQYFFSGLPLVKNELDWVEYQMKNESEFSCTNNFAPAFFTMLPMNHHLGACRGIIIVTKK